MQTGAASEGLFVEERRARQPWNLPWPWLAGVLFSLAVATPCLIQRRIQASDLPSHVYNVWLTQLTRAGRAPGLELHAQWSNTLFDHILEACIGAFGFAAGEKVAVIAAVLIFFWGLFALASSAAGEPAWKIAPLIAVFCYGWAFSAGFMNMYLSLGLMFLALAVIREARGWQLLWLLPLLAAISAAHLLGTAAVLALGALFALLRWKPGWRWELGAIAALAACTGGALFWIRTHLPTMEEAADLSQRMLGFDQLVLYRHQYLWAALAAMGAAFVVMASTLARERGAALCRVRLCLLLTAAGALVLPILPNGFVTRSSGLIGLLPPRISMIVAAAFLCALAGTARRWWHCLLLSLAVLPFLVLYFQDVQSINRLERTMTRAVQLLPPGARVITAINLPPQESRISISHLLDRACIGHCYSYGNYEPGSGQFRLRAVRRNAIATASWQNAIQMESGNYLPERSEQPLYSLYFCQPGSRDLCMAPLPAREDAAPAR
jgi:MFS family permease